VLQAAAELELTAETLPPEILEAKVDIFLWISGLPHSGQVTVSIALPKTNSSNGCEQLSHSNSKIGILPP
jgi:hypothetical protein